MINPNQSPCAGLKQALADGVQLLDVRSRAECASGVLPGAINLPLNEINRAPEVVDFEETLLVYCRSGQRSEMARMLLAQMGHTDVWNIGGYDHYRHCLAK